MRGSTPAPMKPAQARLLHLTCASDGHDHCISEAQLVGARPSGRYRAGLWAVSDPGGAGGALRVTLPGLRDGARYRPQAAGARCGSRCAEAAVAGVLSIHQRSA